MYHHRVDWVLQSQTFRQQRYPCLVLFWENVCLGRRGSVDYQVV